MAYVPTPYDYNTQKGDIDRRQQITDAMLSSALSPMQSPQNPGRIASRTSPVEALSKLVQAYMAKKQGEGLKAEREGLETEQAQRLSSGVENYLRTSQGAEAGLSEDGMPSAAVPGDMKKAVMEALASGHPVLQAMAMRQLEQMNKQGVGLEAKDLVALATPESVLANPNNPAGWSPKRKLDALPPGEMLIDEGGNITEPGARQGQAPPAVGGAGNLPSGAGWGTVKIGEDLYQQSATGLKKLDNATRVNNTVSVNPVLKGEGSFMEGLGKDTAAMVQEARKRKVAAEANLVTAKTLENLDQQGTFSGPTANIATTLSSFANTLGIPVDGAKLASSETYQAELGKRVAEILTSGAGVGRSFTDADRVEFMKQFPQLVTSPQGRASIIAKMRETAAKDLAWYQQVDENVRKNYPEAAPLMQLSPANVDYPAGEVAPPPADSKTIKWGDL